MASNATSWEDDSNQWTSAADWSAGTVPDSTSDVTISTGNPQINTDVGTISSLTVTSTGAFTINAPFQVAQLTVAGTFANAGDSEIIANDADATMTVASINNDSATGALSLWGSGPLRATLEVTGSAGFGTAGVLTGSVALSSISLIKFDGGGQITDIQGSLSLFGSKALVADASDTTSNSALTGLSSIEGSLMLVDGSSVTTSGDLSSSGQIYVYSGSGNTSLSIGGTFTTSDYNRIYSEVGTATIHAASINNTGTLDMGGSGTEKATLDIDGAAGFGSAGVLTGSVWLGNVSVIKFEAGGQITDIKGDLHLDGTQAFIADGSDPSSNSALAGLSSVEGDLYLSNGASVTTSGGLVNTGGIFVEGGNLVIHGPATGSGTFAISTGGTLEVGSSSSANISFWDGNGTFKVDGAGVFSGSLTGFQKGDSFIVNGASGISYDPATGTITYTLADGSTQTTNVGTGYDPSLWTDTNGVITYDTPLPCYVSGTLIRTPNGDVPVEGLRAGDKVLTASGREREVTWVGSRSLDFRANLAARGLLPYRIRAHALGENRPVRDLFLSPDHGVAVTCVTDILIPIKHLDNGATITRLPVDEVTYWHIELEEHDLLLAENLPAESFLDTFGQDVLNRSDLDTSKKDFVTRSARPRAELPRAKTWEQDACLPLVTEGPILQVVRMQLLKRVEALGWSLTDDAALHFEASDGGGGDIEVSCLSDSLYRLNFSSCLGDIAFASNSFVPRHADLNTFDDRRLGVPLHRLEIHDIAADRRLRIGLEDPALAAGFHPVQDYEGDAWRWTDGRGIISAALWTGMEGRVELEVKLAVGRGTMRAWVEPETAKAQHKRARLGKKRAALSS